MCLGRFNMKKALYCSKVTRFGIFWNPIKKKPSSMFFQTLAYESHVCSLSPTSKTFCTIFVVLQLKAPNMALLVVLRWHTQVVWRSLWPQCRARNGHYKKKKIKWTLWWACLVEIAYVWSTFHLNPMFEAPASKPIACIIINWCGLSRATRNLTFLVLGLIWLP